MKINKLFFQWLSLTFSLIFLPLLFLYNKNPGEVWFSDVMILLLILFFLNLILTIIFYVLKKNILHSSLASFFCFLPLILINEAISYKINLLVWVLFFIVGISFLLLKISNKFLNKLYVCLVLPLLILIGLNGISIASSKLHIFKAKNLLTKEMGARFISLKKEQNNKILTTDRDIYFIILDELVSPNTFRNYYHYDNNSFFEFLQNTGFHLVEYPYSNYPWTITSVPSMVMMNYHKNWVSKKEFPELAHFLINYNFVAKLLKSDGYKFYYVPSIYWLGNPSKGIWEDFLFRSKSYSLTLSLLRSTPFAKIARNHQKEEHRKYIHWQINQIKNISTNKAEKKFIFAHLLCPHRPIIFDKTGDKLKDENLELSEKDKDHKYYLNQSYYISQCIQDLINTILKNSKSSPIIVLLSDHGKFPIGVSGKGSKTMPLKDLSWRFSNFIALYSPNSSLQMPEILTPINIFPLILNAYYGYKIDLNENICHTDTFDLEKGCLTKDFIQFQTKQ